MSFNFKVFRGDSLQINTVVTLSGSPVDLTGCTLFFTVKRKLSDTDAQALISCQTGTGIAHTNPALGQAAITVAAASLNAMPANAPLYADLQLKTASGEIYTVASGKITFNADVTLRTT